MTMTGSTKLLVKGNTHDLTFGELVFAVSLMLDSSPDVLVKILRDREEKKHG